MIINKTFTLILLYIGIVSCRNSYRSNVPNGQSVPNPCQAGQIVGGFGHKSFGGAGERNQFGLDFDGVSRKWTTELCQKDSDGDGKSNGAELGDPECAWTSGSTATLPKPTGHPGVCEPVNDEKCKTYNTALGASNLPCLGGSTCYKTIVCRD